MLFIWNSIHKPHVEIDIIVNSNFIFSGRLIVVKLFNEVVISKIDNIIVFVKSFFNKVVGSMLKNIIVPSIVINVFIFFVILFIIKLKNGCVLLFKYCIFLGLIRMISMKLDKMFREIINSANFVLKMCFKYVYIKIGDVYFVTDKCFVIFCSYLFNIYALAGDPDIILNIYI